MEEIPHHALARERVREDALLFYILASASFIEITSDLYTRNLVEFFRHDSEVIEWLENGWESEELQHGAALKRYVETAWPEFDWDATYRSFLDEFSWSARSSSSLAHVALEMAARCVEGTGTAAFYCMLSELTSEPVLGRLAREISVDEVRHYKHFYRYFVCYREREQPSCAAVPQTLWSRIAEVDAEDAFCAFKHVYLARNPGAEFRKCDYEAFRTGARQLAKKHFPHGMAIKMLLKPLGLSAAVGRVAVPTMTSVAGLLVR